jgi:hypothetical protein
MGRTFATAMTMPHPDSGRLAAYAERRLPPEDRATIEAHLADCADCRRDATATSILLGAEKRSRFWRVAVPLAAAALVTVVILPRDEPPPDAYRPGRAREGVMAIQSWAPDERAAPGDSLRFVWGPVGTSTLYRLTVTDDAGGITWTASVEDTAVTVPNDVRLEPGRRYHWYVDALLANGQRATTGLRDFQISP